MDQRVEHVCGARLVLRIENDGLEYTARILDPGTREDLESCPGCGASLSHALAAGELPEVPA